MTDTSKYHLPKGTSADGPYDLLVTPESAGWGCSGLRILTLKPGRTHALSTRDSEFLVLPLTGSCTVTTDGTTFELAGRTGVFTSTTDFAYLPRESEALIGSADGGTFALPAARTGRSSLSARYGPKQNVPVELRGAGACSRQVNNYCLPGTFEAEQLLVCEVLTSGGNWSSYPPHKHDEARPGIEAVSFVGSTPIPKYVHEQATSHGKRVQALGGAKNHAVVLPDADLGFAANHITAGAYGSAGERCMAVSVAVAVGAADSLVEVLERKAREVRVGPGDVPGTEMRPLVTKAAQERIENAVAVAATQGATVVVDGRGLKIDGHEEGFFTGPSLLDRVTTEMDAYREELFGPLLAVVRVDTPDEAIDLINANPYGNGTALFTASGEAARRFQRRIKVGVIGINVPVPVPMSYYSFDGWKDSLIGDSPVHGPEDIRFYTRPKVVTTRWPQPKQQVNAGFNFPTSS